MTDDINPSYYAILEADVRYDNDLKPNEKLLYAEITALSKKEGYCWAGNKYFAGLFDVTKRTVSRWVNNLEDKGYITRALKKNDAGQVVERKITPIDKKVMGCRQKKHQGIDKNVQENSTSVNSTSVNNNYGKQDLPTASNLPKENGRKQYPEQFEEVWSAYPKRNYPSKGAAYKKYRARINDGADHQVLLKAARNYQKVCEQEDKIGSQYVMKAKTFFGPSEHWVEFVDGDFEIEEEKDTAFKTEFNGDADEYEY